MADDIMAMLASTAGSLGSARDRDQEKNAPLDPKRRTPEAKAAAAKAAAAKLKKAREAARGSASDDRICTACSLTVFAAERRDVEVGGQTDHYHEGCFRCADCQVQLKLSTFVSVSRSIYCGRHAKEHAADAGNARGKREEQLKASKYAGDAVALAREQKDREERAARAKEVGARLREDGLSLAASCRLCGKAVYNAEKVSVQVLTYEDAWEFHKSCFKCSKCGLQLTLRNYSSIGGVVYCQPHAHEAGPQQAKSDAGYFVSPLKDAEYHKPETSVVSVDASASHNANTGNSVDRGDDLELAKPGSARRDLSSRGSSARILEAAESAVQDHVKKSTRALLAEEGVQVSDEDDSAAERARRREERRRQLAEELAHEEAELEKRRLERAARRAALSDGGSVGEDNNDNHRSERKDSSADLDDFERRKAERRARLEALRKG